MGLHRSSQGWLLPHGQSLKLVPEVRLAFASVRELHYCCRRLEWVGWFVKVEGYRMREPCLCLVEWPSDRRFLGRKYCQARGLQNCNVMTVWC